MALDAQTEKDLLEKVGKEATDATKAAIKGAEDALNAQFETLKKGGMTQAEFDSFKKETLEPINTKLAALDEIPAAVKKQGEEMAKLIGKGTPNSKTFYEFMEEKKEAIQGFYKTGTGMLEITGAQLKAAGVSTIGTSIPTASPYAPGISGAPLEIFEIARNPNYITSKVNLGRTNQSRLAWINELDLQGAVALVTEGNLKPLTQHRFTVETSVAKKAAAYFGITEELQDDIPGLATMIQRMLQQDVLRFWDDTVQADVIAAATPYNITQLNGKIQAANYFDAFLALVAQVGYYNFTPNTVAMNYLTMVLEQAGVKTTQNEYLLPSFAKMLDDMTNYANKVQTSYGLVGDLKQFNVDIYKDFVLKIGWVNDDLIRNQYSVVGEIRWHDYISTARKTAIAYDNLDTIVGLINKP